MVVLRGEEQVGGLSNKLVRGGSSLALGSGVECVRCGVEQRRGAKAKGVKAEAKRASKARAERGCVCE